MNTIVVRKQRIDAPDENPPTYSPSSRVPITPIPPGMKPCNYVSVSKTNVTGAFAIDPTLRMPPTLPRPVEAGNEMNLSLKAEDAADVDIYLVAGGRGSVANSRTRLSVAASFINSTSTVRLVRWVHVIECNSY